MKIEILYVKNDSIENPEEEKEIIVRCGKNEIIVSKKSEDWTNDGINNFLIKIATSIPEGEEMEIEFDEKNEDITYRYIYELFQGFVNEYNRLTRNNSQISE